MKKRAKLPTIFLAIAFLLAVGMRILTAYTLRTEANGDLAVVQLMVKDILCGNIPAFFSGQAYMGSLEPIVNAFFNALIPSNFGTNLGTALFAILTIIVVARISKRLTGTIGAIFCILFLIISPQPFAHYAASPRGGYGVLFLVTAILLDEGYTIISKCRANKEIPTKSIILLAFATGIGFWCNQLVAPAALAVAITALIFSPSLLGKIKLYLLAIPSFLLGSAPYIIWNMHNNWESMDMSGSLVLDPIVALRNIPLLFSRIISLFGLQSPYATPQIRTIYLILVAIPLILPIVALLRKKDADPSTQNSLLIQLTLIYTYFITFSLCFIFSHFATFDTPRYLLPLIPLYAVLFAISTTHHRLGYLRYLSAIALIAHIGWQISQYNLFFSREKRHTAFQTSLAKAATFLENQGCDAGYANFLCNPANLHSHVAFADPNIERRPDFRRRAELSDSPCVLENCQGFTEWAIASGGYISTTNFDGVRVAWNPIPPPRYIKCVPFSEWKSASLKNGIDVKNILTNLNREFAVDIDPFGDTLTVNFTTPQNISALFFTATETHFMQNFIVEAQLPDGTYATVANVPDVKAEWSGPRFYPSRHAIVRSASFPTIITSSMRITFVCKTPMPNGHIYALSFVSATDNETLKTPEDWKNAIEELELTLENEKIEHLYAERYIANSISELSGGKITTNCGDDLYPKITGHPRQPSILHTIKLTPNTAVLIPIPGIGVAAELFAKHDINMRKVELPPLGAIFIPSSTQNHPLSDPTGITFYDNFILSTPNGIWAKAAYASRGPQALPELLKLYPNSPFLLEKALESDISEKAQEVIENRLRHFKPKPYLDDDATFDDKYNFSGYRILNPKLTYSPNDEIHIRYFWHLSHEINNKDHTIRVFIHFTGPNGYRFQDDHPLISYHTEVLGTDEEGDVSIINDRDFIIPQDAPSGTYEIRIGLYDTNFSSARLKLETDYNSHRNALILGPIFTINK